MSKSMKKEYPAILNGEWVWASKSGGRWLVGGDVVKDAKSTPTIMLKKETGYIDKETGKNETRYAWFMLKGSHLKFSDWASEDEIEKGRKLLAKRGIEMAKTDLLVTARKAATKKPAAKATKAKANEALKKQPAIKNPDTGKVDKKKFSLSIQEMEVLSRSVRDLHTLMQPPYNGDKVRKYIKTWAALHGKKLLLVLWTMMQGYDRTANYYASRKIDQIANDISRDMWDSMYKYAGGGDRTNMPGKVRIPRIPTGSDKLDNVARNVLDVFQGNWIMHDAMKNGPSEDLMLAMQALTELKLADLKKVARYILGVEFVATKKTQQDVINELFTFLQTNFEKKYKRVQEIVGKPKSDPDAMWRAINDAIDQYEKERVEKNEASMKIKSTSPFGKKFKATSALDTKPKTRERAIAATAEEYDALIEGIKSAAKTVFPNGWCMAEARKYIGQLNISVRGGIIGDMSELTQRIPDNDPAYFHFLVRPVKEGYEIEHLVGFGVKVKPTTQGYAMGVHKVKLRKTKGDAAKIIETFKKHMQKLKKAVQEQNENVYQREKYSDKFFK